MSSSDAPTRAASDDALLRRVFGFDADEHGWFRRVRACEDDLPVGRIGAFELLDQIGHGGQGVVYRARQPGTGREIAVKRLSAGVFATPQMRARFEREIEAAVALDHPNIVTVFGTEEVEGQTVLAMKYIDGEPIDQWARPEQGNRRELREILRLFRTVCEAVHHAHQRGVIHRDLKPSNILVDREGRPFVLDFGLAKVRREEPRSYPVTETGEFLGTPAYAAPEQVIGDPRLIDVRTDVYSLGAVLYHLLAGRPPVPQLVDFAGLMHAITSEEPPNPSTLDRTLNEEIDGITLKALSKEKDRRYSSVAEFSEDVRRFLEGEAVLALPPSRAYRFLKYYRRHRFAVVGSVALVTLLIATTTISTTFYLRSEEARVVASTERDRAIAAEALEREQRQVAERAIATEKEQRRRSNEYMHAQEIIIDGVIGSYASTNATTPDPTPMSAQGLMRIIADRSAEERSGRVLVHAQILGCLGIAAARMGFSTLSLDFFNEAVEINRQYRGDNDVALAQHLSNLGWALCERGRFDEAEKATREGLALRERNLGGDNIYVANLQSLLGRILANEGQLEEAENSYREALELFRRHVGPKSSDVAATRRGLANVFTRKGHWAMAEREFREALKLFDEIRHDRPGEVLATRNDLGECLMRQGRAVEAESLFRDTLKGQQELFGHDHSPAFTTVANLGWSLWAQGRLLEAELYYRESLDGRRRVLGNEHPHTVSVMQFEGQILTEIGRADEAEPLLREVLAARRKALPPRHADLVPVLVDLGRALVLTARFEEAAPILQEAWSVSKDELPKDHLHAGLAQGFLGEVLTAQGQFPESETLLLASNRIIHASPQARATHRKQSTDRLSRLYQAWGKPEQAPSQIEPE